jgi:5-methylthioadenosine/S-adenosylhomocysteine deaminase
MKLASGIAPIPEMISRGLHPGLGTDGSASNNNLDMFGEMDTAAKAAKVFANDPTAISSQTVLKMATSWGSAVAGLDGQIGTIEVGKEADVIIVDAKRPHMRPLYDPISSLVYCAGGSDVRDVIVAGKILVRGHRFLGIEPGDILKEIRRLGSLIEKSLPLLQLADI